MKVLRYAPLAGILIAIFLSFNSFAMIDSRDDGLYIPNPNNELIKEDGRTANVWTWINDDLCIQISGTDKKTDRATCKTMYDYGMITHWSENGQIKKRDTYIGKWSQSAEGVWSFKFDDMTIPIELTKIDGVLYAFNGYGELVEGIEYWNGQKTGADGVVTCTDPEFQEWLKTQYVPEGATTKTE